MVLTSERKEVMDKIEKEATPKNYDGNIRLRNRLLLFGLVAAPIAVAVVTTTNPLYKA
jgi:hypothetical protein